MNILKMLRHIKGVKQTELENYLGVSHHNMVMYEKGLKAPDEELRLKIAQFFKVTLDSLNIEDSRNLFALMLGDTIRDLRLKWNFTQEELAKQVGVSNSTISDWEKGIVEPKASSIYQLAKIFDITTDYLLGLNNFLDEFIASPPICDDMSNDEQQLIMDFRNLNASGKTLIRYSINTLLTTSGENEQKKKMH